MSLILPVRWVEDEEFDYGEHTFFLVNSFIDCPEVSIGYEVANGVVVSQQSGSPGLRFNFINTDNFGCLAPLATRNACKIDVQSVAYACYGGFPTDQDGFYYKIGATNPVFIDSPISGRKGRLPTGELTEGNQGSFPDTNYGVAQYTPGDYPVPTGSNVITVGPGSEDYSTVWDAYQAASDGDHIVISAGTYTENNFKTDIRVDDPSYPSTTIQKHVSFWGADEDPSTTIIQFTSTSANDSGIQFDLAARPQSRWGHAIGVYHLTLRRTGKASGSVCLYVRNLVI